VERVKYLVILTLELKSQQVTLERQVRILRDTTRTELLAQLRRVTCEEHGAGWDDAVIAFFYAERDALD
jgi:hypothetical protein